MGLKKGFRNYKNFSLCQNA